MSSKLGSSAGVGSGVDLKDSEEVADYIENLGIEYRFGCYHEKDPKACHLLGDYWESIKKDFSKALKIYRFIAFKPQKPNETDELLFQFQHQL